MPSLIFLLSFGREVIVIVLHHPWLLMHYVPVYMFADWINLEPLILAQEIGISQVHLC